MDDFEKSFTQIKQLSTAVTDENYYDCGKQGYEHYTSLQEGLSKDWFADMLDYICGWCNPEKYIWKEY